MGGSDEARNLLHIPKDQRGGKAGKKSIDYWLLVLTGYSGGLAMPNPRRSARQWFKWADQQIMNADARIKEGM